MGLSFGSWPPLQNQYWDWLNNWEQRLLTPYLITLRYQLCCYTKNNTLFSSVTDLSNVTFLNCSLVFSETTKVSRTESFLRKNKFHFPPHFSLIFLKINNRLCPWNAVAILLRNISLSVELFYALLSILFLLLRRTATYKIRHATFLIKHQIWNAKMQVFIQVENEFLKATIIRNFESL